jgi:hypothetical protein
MSQDSETCVECGESTAFGSGRFVNRIPAESAGSPQHLAVAGL